MPNTIINLKRLYILLEDLQILTGMGISFWHPDGVNCVATTANVPSKFCALLQSVPDMKLACTQCEMRALEAAKSDLRIHTFRCHAGLEECVCPVAYNGKLLGYFMIGQVRIASLHPKMPLEKRDWYEAHNLPYDQVCQAYEALPEIMYERRAAAMRILESLTGFVYLERLVRQVNLSLVTRIEHYIAENLTSKITLPQIARALRVSPSTICHTLQEEKNTTLTRLVNTRRIEMVTAALEAGATLTAASKEAGFSSPFYCSRVFLQYTGKRPEAYRTAFHTADRLES